jgi:hypothetical protein
VERSGRGLYKYYPGIRIEGLKKIIKILSHDSRSRDWAKTVNVASVAVMQHLSLKVYEFTVEVVINCDYNDRFPDVAILIGLLTFLKILN